VADNETSEQVVRGQLVSLISDWHAIAINSNSHGMLNKTLIIITPHSHDTQFNLSKAANPFI
jgi:hypothetical protein